MIIVTKSHYNGHIWKSEDETFGVFENVEKAQEHITKLFYRGETIVLNSTDAWDNSNKVFEFWAKEVELNQQIKIFEKPIPIMSIGYE